MSLDLVRETVRTLRKATHLPISAKIRLGTRLDEQQLLSFCTMLEGEGVDLLTVHGRLQGEKFCRRPRWDWIGKVKDNVTIPVFANGGIFTVDDAKRCLQQSNADGLPLGRGAVCRPWLFAQIAKEVYNSENELKYSMPDVYFRFVELLNDRFLPERRLGRLKQFSHYYAENFTFGHHLEMGVQNSKTVTDAIRVAEDFFKTIPGGNYD
jgi:tRNA-dihydrouridine synthase